MCKAEDLCLRANNTHIFVFLKTKRKKKYRGKYLTLLSLLHILFVLSPVSLTEWFTLIVLIVMGNYSSMHACFNKKQTSVISSLARQNQVKQSLLKAAVMLLNDKNKRMESVGHVGHTWCRTAREKTLYVTLTCFKLCRDMM